MLWTFQGWLAMFFIGAAYAKLTAPPPQLTILLGWADGVALSWVRGAGLVELMLAITMLVPIFGWRIGRRVVLVGAGGLFSLQAVVLCYHLTQFHIGHILVNMVLLALTIVVFAGRRQPLRAIHNI